ncbi:heterokaryon incompatibility protein-domain-containing protein [Aspergillus granulosus]|uniref:Heterokaryon incompatibility protein-domain-containing protein n=1 Tax=Aspergillus granulosus TaxID=176169 RepID=A0ABR4GSQ7_9EURO
MAAVLPLRVICRNVTWVTEGADKPRKVTKFTVEDPRKLGVQRFDIVSYRWGKKANPWSCAQPSQNWDGLPGVNWRVTVRKAKLKEILRLMEEAEIDYLWTDCVCLDQENEAEKLVEVGRMYEYYKNADKCHIIINMDDVANVQDIDRGEHEVGNEEEEEEEFENNDADEALGAPAPTMIHNPVWDPQTIIDDLKFLDHILHHMVGAARATDALLSPNVIRQLSEWAEAPWLFRMSQSAVRAAAVEPGILNCYATCVSHVRSLFRNLYFSRVWTFQEMLLGKNITMWGVNPDDMKCIGQFGTWMDLAIDATDKAIKLRDWIDKYRKFNTQGVNAILQLIKEDLLGLNFLRTQVQGINSARTDIIAGGPRWWQDNYKGICNVFSAISIWPRKCERRVDIFFGLLGVFSGLFTEEELKHLVGGSGEEIEPIAFAFFKQLSLKTGRAWTRLAISSGKRGEWDWIPVAANPKRIRTTDIFAGVVDLGSLRPKGRVKCVAVTGFQGTPRQYIKFQPQQQAQNWGFKFSFRGCNAGKKVKTSIFKSERIPLNDQMRNIVGDETGRILVEVSTILGALLDPAGHLVEYRRRLLDKLQPRWRVTDPNAKPVDWIDRCVSGTPWEISSFEYIRAHNYSMSYHLQAVYDCQSRLYNDSTKDISCEVRINCGCTIVAPFYFVLEAIIAVHGSFLGKVSVDLDRDNRIILQDGVGLIQPGDVGKGFHIVAFKGNINAHRLHASSCRNTMKDKPVFHPFSWPHSRAIVRDDFNHAATDMMKDYGYIQTGGYVQGDGAVHAGGSGNLLICRNNPVDDYRIVGVYIDNFIGNRKREKKVVIR